ncbi:MAG: iron-containing alcohol dehydrogenase [Victivallaceae bacterium]
MDKYIDDIESYPDTAVVFGENCLIEFENLMRHCTPSKIVAFTGKSSVEANGAWGRFLKAAALLDAAVVRYSQIEPEPCIETVEAMVDLLENESPDQVVAIGGGSIMDAAKAAFLVYQGGGSVSNYFGVNRFSENNPGVKLRKVICFPTTSGTGSEVTPYANVVDKKMMVKKLIVEKEIIPAYSFVCPSFANSMPPHVTLATGCDALAHSIEGFLNVGQDSSHPSANHWAIESIRLIVNNLPLVLKDSHDRHARAAMAAAATLGGMVIRYKPTGLPHLCSFSWFGKIEHGIAVAMLLPHAWNYYIQNPAVQTRTMLLNDIFPGSTPAGVIQNYRDFLDSIGIPRSLKTFEGITPELLEQTAASAGQNKMKLELAPHPVPLDQSKAILGEILKQAWQG